MTGSRPRVVHVYKDYYPVIGGIENTIRSLAMGTSRMGYDVTVLVTNTSGTTRIEEIDGIKVVKTGRQLKLASNPVSVQMLTALRGMRADIVHLQFPFPWGDLAYHLSGHKNLLVTYQSDVVKQKSLLQFYRPILLKTLGAAKIITAASPNYIRTSPYLRKFKEKCLTVPLGINVHRFEAPAMDKASNLRNRYGTPLILFVGVFRYYKGIPFLLRAMREIDAHLVLVGKGPLQSELESLVTELGIANKVHFAGQVTDEELPDYYAAADIFVLPSSHRSEAFGLSLAEAMASGLPAISTELGTGTSFVNLNGQTGIVVPPADPAALSQAIAALLNDAELRAKYGTAGRERARTVFSEEAMVAGFDKVYKQMLST